MITLVTEEYRGTRKMSQIHNSLEYYQSSQGLLRMLNKDKGGNALINQLVSNNDLKYQQKMEAMGISKKTSNTKYKNVDKSATNLLDALENLSDEKLYVAESGKEYDKSTLLKGVSNFVTAYNSTITELAKCGGSLNETFYKELSAAYQEKRADLEKIGISLVDGKLTIDQDKLNAAQPEDIKAILGKNTDYVNTVRGSLESIDTIVNKALAMSSSTYNPQGMLNL